MASVTPAQLCRWDAKAVVVNNQWVEPHSKRTLFMDTDIWISYNFHMAPNIIPQLIFFSFKYAETICSSWAVEKQVVGWIWLMSCGCWLWFQVFYCRRLLTLWLPPCPVLFSHPSLLLSLFFLHLQLLPISPPKVIKVILICQILYLWNPFLSFLFSISKEWGFLLFLLGENNTEEMPF